MQNVDYLHLFVDYLHLFVDYLHLFVDYLHLFVDYLHLFVCFEYFNIKHAANTVQKKNIKTYSPQTCRVIASKYFISLNYPCLLKGRTCLLFLILCLSKGKTNIYFYDNLMVVAVAVVVVDFLHLLEYQI